ncbi:hypothetical protein NDU88_004713 [Pleurodeles waltl]|uniref:Uncharacterized protein n=1 Tax=Pleurodeles waltl TaxID=8319 RepID=A0AAV7VJH5_PLEWA|nr:hypothetical protein NDU88_004713 [Pleurodeles waltl]
MTLAPRGSYLQCWTCCGGRSPGSEACSCRIQSPQTAVFHVEMRSEPTRLLEPLFPHLYVGCVASDPSHLSWTPRPLNDHQVYDRRRRANAKASRHRRAKASDFKVREMILIKDRFPGNTFRLPFGRYLWIIVWRQGTLVVARRDPEEVARNISAFKLFHLQSHVPETVRRSGSLPEVSDLGPDEGQSDLLPLSPLPLNSGRGTQEESNAMGPVSNGVESPESHATRMRYEL